MSDGFMKNPILNSPYSEPTQHWALDASGQPIGEVRPGRRSQRYVMPVARSKKGPVQSELGLDAQGKPDNTLVQSVRPHVDAWRRLPSNQWGTTPETERLLRWWRDRDVRKYPFFFCQLEAIETLIWLNEVAPKEFRETLLAANELANPNLLRIASKMATGAGKTTVMAMIIAWQAINAARRPSNNRFAAGFLIVTPGITIRDRLRILRPEELDNYYCDPDRRVVPDDLMPDLLKADVVITNYHAFQLRERAEMTGETRDILGRRTVTESSEGDIDVKIEPRRFIETPGQMIHRVAPSLANKRRLVVINDEAHHCYKESATKSKTKLNSDEAAEARENNASARLWMSGVEAFREHCGLVATYDLSATPFFLKGSGHPEGTLFPWVVSDFSLMDAIESGIVKTPRLPVLDDAPAAAAPKFRALYENLPQNALPKRGRKQTGELDPADLPELLRSAMEALYAHYERTDAEWQRQGLDSPPVFIVVANNTATSKLIFDFLSGYEDPTSGRLIPGATSLFSNVDPERRSWRSSPRTILVDSAALEAGDVLPDEFRRAAAVEIEDFRRQVSLREGQTAAMNLSDAAVLREVMNTVGHPGKLGANIRCVVSVAMLSEGWDVNTVTHVLGVRAFGTQLLCEQVVGRALRRVSYYPGADGLLTPEYADVLGVPFDFTRDASVATIRPPPRIFNVRALDERRQAEITFPNVQGYRVTYPPGPLRARFDEDSKLSVSSEDVPGETIVEPVVGEGITLSLENYRDQRMKSVYFAVAGFTLRRYFRPDAHPKDFQLGDQPEESREGDIPYHRFAELLAITERWFNECLETHGSEERKRLFLWRPFAQKAAERIARACGPSEPSAQHVRAIVNPYNERGSTTRVRFQTSKPVFQTDREMSHLDYMVEDSGWEEHLVRTLETKFRDSVAAYVKNHNLGFEVPYEYAGETLQYRPDFILRLRNGLSHINVVVEVKGLKDDKDRAKADTMKNRWIPGVNALKRHGLWTFLELTSPFAFERELRLHLENLPKALVAMERAQ